MTEISHTGPEISYVEAVLVAAHSREGYRAKTLRKRESRNPKRELMRGVGSDRAECESWGRHSRDNRKKRNERKQGSIYANLGCIYVNLLTFKDVFGISCFGGFFQNLSLYWASRDPALFSPLILINSLLGFRL